MEENSEVARCNEGREINNERFSTRDKIDTATG